MIRNTLVMTGSTYLSMFFLGVAISLIGAAARNIGLSPSQIAVMTTLQNLGFMVSVWISGALADTIEKPKILLVGSLILAPSFYTFYVTGSFFVNLLIMFAIGLGIGSYEGVTDALLLDLHPTRESLYININHLFVTLGSLVVTSYLILLQMQWRRSIIQSATAVLLLAVIFAFTKATNVPVKAATASQRMRFLMVQPTVLILFLAMVCTIGVQLGLLGMLTTFLMESRDFTQVTSKVALVVFLGAVAGARLLVGYLSRTKFILRTITIFFGCSAFFLTLLLLVKPKPITYLLIFLTGAASSANLPLIIALAGIMYRDMSGTVMGIVKIAIPTGGIVVPFLLSLLTASAPLQSALMLLPAVSLSALLLLVFSRRAFRPKPAAKPL